MLKFLTRFLGLSDEEAELALKRANEKMFFIETSKILHKDETQSGLIQNIKLAKNAKFHEIVLTDSPKVDEKKFGMSKVIQNVALFYENDDQIFDLLDEIRNNKKTISVLYVTKDNKCSLLGENKGLQITELGHHTIKMEGEENDVFYKVSVDYLEKFED